MDDTLKTQVVEIINSLVTPISGPIELELLKEGDQWRVNIISDNGAQLMGFHGELLNALQHLVRVIFHKKNPNDRSKFLLDVQLIRQKREGFINNQIPILAKEEVLKTGATYIFKNLTSYERKIIHSLLADVTGLETLSVGDGMNRKLLIRPTSETGSLGMDNSKIIDINMIQKLEVSGS